MTKEELLVKAKKDYPIGTAFKSVYGYPGIVTSEPILVAAQDHIYVECRDGVKRLIYQNGDWAIINPGPRRSAMLNINTESQRFVLPEKWCVKGLDNIEIVNYFKQNSKNNFIYSQNQQYFHSENLIRGAMWILSVRPHHSHTEITFAEFKKHVLKIKDKPIMETKVKVLKHEITEVQNEDGSILRLGDEVIHNNLKQARKHFIEPSKITSFMKDDDKILATTTYRDGKLGININKLELHIDSFVLPINWYVKITAENRQIVRVWFEDVKNYGRQYVFSNGAYYGEKVLTNNLKAGQANDNISNMLGDLITFEEFQKYVLNQ